jgi:hypothetical protein
LRGPRVEGPMAPELPTRYRSSSEQGRESEVESTRISNENRVA